ncbi:hypothetical protein BDQ17DRAFT_1308587 [Cyathus striatus]|nr:hypothetical protein BDQ17DRAFT_1308587 [Cyathus striatus]
MFNVFINNNRSMSLRLKFADMLVIVSLIVACTITGAVASVDAPNVSGHALTASECANPPRDQCRFYADCLERRYQCGNSGYPLGYGQKFCLKFSEQRNKLSPQGQKWMLDTMQCLQRTLVPDALDTSTADSTCEALNDRAFNSHPGCYVKNGVCSLHPTDWIAILEIVHLKTLFSSWQAVTATLGALDGCVNFYLFLLEHIGLLNGLSKISQHSVAHCLIDR